MKFNKSKCWVFHLGWDNLGYTYKLGDERLESSPVERGLGVWVYGKLSMSQQCALAAKKASRILGCVKQVIVPLHAALMQPHLKYCVQFCVPQQKKDIELFECVQRRVTQTVKGLEGKTYEEWPRVTWLVQLGEEKAEG